MMGSLLIVPSVIIVVVSLLRSRAVDKYPVTIAVDVALLFIVFMAGYFMNRSLTHAHQTRWHFNLLVVYTLLVARPVYLVLAYGNVLSREKQMMVIAVAVLYVFVWMSNLIAFIRYRSQYVEM